MPSPKTTCASCWPCSSKVSLAIENALKFRQAESCATTDYLTGLPNARSLVPASGRRTGPLQARRARRSRFWSAISMASNRSTTALGISKATACCRCRGRQFQGKLPRVRLRRPHGRRRIRGGHAGIVADQAMEERIAQFETAVRACGEASLRRAHRVAERGRRHLPGRRRDAEGLLAEADHRMYADKQKHKTLNAAGFPALQQPVPWATMTVQ